MGNDWYYKIVSAGGEPYDSDSDDSDSDDSAYDDSAYDDSDYDEPGTLIGDDKLPSVKSNHHFETGDGTLASIVKNMTELIASISEPLLENNYTDLPAHPDQEYSSEYVPKEVYDVQKRLEAISVMAYLAAQVAPRTIREQVPCLEDPVDDDRGVWRVKLNYW